MYLYLNIYMSISLIISIWWIFCLVWAHNKVAVIIEVAQSDDYHWSGTNYLLMPGFEGTMLSKQHYESIVPEKSGINRFSASHDIDLF